MLCMQKASFQVQTGNLAQCLSVSVSMPFAHMVWHLFGCYPQLSLKAARKVQQTYQQ